jgi:hypothetical protein
MLHRVLFTSFVRKSIVVLVSHANRFNCLWSDNPTETSCNVQEKAKPVKKEALAKKEALPKPKPLTAKDYRAAEERLAEPPIGRDLSTASGMIRHARA